MISFGLRARPPHRSYVRTGRTRMLHVTCHGYDFNIMSIFGTVTCTSQQNYSLDYVHIYTLFYLNIVWTH